MKSSEILRKAARLVERGARDGGCCAILDASINDPYGDYCRALRKLNSVKPDSPGLYWWDIYSEDGHNARIIGLCLAAAIAESEGD